jgi:hypothetical protein
MAQTGRVPKKRALTLVRKHYDVANWLILWLIAPNLLLGFLGLFGPAGLVVAV